MYNVLTGNSPVASQHNRERLRNKSSHIDRLFLSAASPHHVILDVVLTVGVSDVIGVRNLNVRVLRIDVGIDRIEQLQVQFMPEALKPPMNTLAGFLKGGRLFGEGAIET